MNSSVLKLLIISFLILLLSASATFYVLREQRTEGSELLSAMEGLNSWDELNRARANLESEDVPNITDRERLSSFVLGDQDDTITFLAFIDELGREVGVAVGTVDLESDRTSEAGFDEIVTTLSLSGTTDSVERMINLLEALPYRSYIERLSLSREGGVAEATIILRASILE